MEVRIELCTSARVYRKDPTRRTLLLSLLVVLYAIAVPFCYMTAGDPRRTAMVHAQKLADERWALESASINFNETSLIETDYDDEVIDPVEGANDVSDDEEVNFGSDGAKKSTNYFASWFYPSKEQKRAKKDFDKWQKEFKEKSGESVTLPPEYLPSAWACLALFATLSLHALFHLLCHWIVAFKAVSLFKPATKVEEGCFVLITPPANRGSGAMVEIKKSTTAGTLQADFQRQKYIYTPASRLGENARKYPNGVFTLSSYPTALPLDHYAAAAGLRSETEVERMVEVWGKNHLAVAIPSFLELLQLQLLSPLAIFQIFCALLWLLDEYWSYTLFTLASVVVYEATTVFQRTRTQQMLGGMSPKPTPIYVYRVNRWLMVTTKDLLPGDIISLSFKKRAPANKPPLVPAAAGTAIANSVTPATTAGTTPAAPAAPTSSRSVTSNDDIVPCDCLLLRGSAVVNEASLTGESVPQMKEAITFHHIAGSTSSTAVDKDKVVTTGIDSSVLDGGASTADKLDMNGVNRVNTLFSGSSIVTVDVRNASVRSKNTEDASSVDSSAAAQESAVAAFAHIPSPPDSGAIAYVLRTGFGSSQGALLQMIEFSQQSVSGDSRETGLALLVLFIFALAASGYVLKEGLRKQEKTTHEILLKCVIIITSVVPRQFPMQMAMAVNMALMSLSKAGIFCTEPFRVPLAGKVSHCLFDKTGTLTTDQLVPVGIINHSTSAAGDEETTIPSLSPVVAASAETAMILAACHSLVVVDDDSAPAAGEDSLKMPTANLVGDPIEVAAIKGIDWSWDAPTSTATPDGAYKRNMIALAISNRSKVNMLKSAPDTRKPTFAKDVEKLTEEIKSLEAKLVVNKQKADAALYSAIQVIQRHHFSSGLQRMSVVCKCAGKSSKDSPVKETSSSSSDHWYCLVKGSPEALKALIVPSAVPSWYSACYEALARKGLRVLALAYKRVYAKDSPQDQPRAWVESDLYFGGFIAFECKIRADSGVVVRSLLQSDHKVAMLTGDALLTSLHVAKQVGICDTTKDSLTLCMDKSAEGSSESKPFWVRRNEVTGEESTVAFDLAKVQEMGATFNLLTTEETFLFVIDITGKKESKLWAVVGAIKVFARMSPQGKASIIRAIQEADKDHHVFMCGDGGNDVGALKQADIGLALLAGHANANTSEDILPPAATDAALLTNATNDTVAAVGTAAPIDPNMSAEDYLNLHEKKLKVRNDNLNKLRVAHMKEFQARYTKEQQALLQEEIRKRTEAGEYMAMFTLMKDQAGKIKQAMAEENMRFMAMHGQVWDPKKDGDGTTKTGVEKMMESMDTGDAGGLQMVRPGDASVAAPFTSRIPSVRAVIDLIRQGRCTLLSALMQQQIMMLESIIAAYTLSALSLHNARSSERQMMASSWLIMTAAVSFSYASPLDHMHPLRPLRSLFHPAIFISILGQAAIHIACMTLAVHWATEAMGPEKLREVTEFFKKAKANEIARDALCGEDDFMCQMQSYWTAPFLPNLLNSVVFLVETSQMISVFFANYKGRPWMKGMLENHPLFLSVFICIGGVIVAAWEMIPQLNDLIQLAPFPDDAFRYKVVILVMATIAGTFLWDRLCTFIFAPVVFKASMEEVTKTGWKDFQPILMTVVKVAAALVILGTGNILLIGGAFWMYRSYTTKLAQDEAAKLA